MAVLNRPISFFLSTIVIVSARYLSKSHALKIWRALNTASADLQFSPTQLTLVDVIFVFVVVISKSFLRVLGLLPVLEPLPQNEGFALPEIRFSAPLDVSQADRENYEEALELLKLPTSANNPEKSDGDSLSLLLASLTTPMMLLTLAHYKSPILPFGAVNTKIRFDFIAPRRCSQCPKTLSINSRSGGAKYPGRRTKRGIEFDVVIEVFEPTFAGSKGSDSTPVGWFLIFRQVVTVMQTLPKYTKPLYRADTDKQEQAIAPMQDKFTLTKQIYVPYHAPSAWARVCRDYNPIHMSALAGRCFGLPGRITHGNYMVAAALRLICLELESAVSKLSAIDVVFRRPLVLPANINIGITPASSGAIQFQILQNSKPAVEGSIRTLNDQHSERKTTGP